MRYGLSSSISCSRLIPRVRCVMSRTCILNLSSNTQHQYIRHVKSFADFVGRLLSVWSFCTAGRRPYPARPRAASHPEAIPPPLDSMALAERISEGRVNMLIARDGEEIVCPKGTISGRMTRDANDQITNGDFTMLETCVSSGGQRYVCACCERAVAVREHFRWRLHLRRGWIR